MLLPKLISTMTKLITADLSRLHTSKFSMTSFYVTSFICPSARVKMQQILYDKFSYVKFYLLV